MSQKGLHFLLLSMADDELVMGHRHSEWTGWAPHIEEDIAFSSIAQDEIGHANLYYKLLSDLDGRSVDELALGRQPEEYINALICERPNQDWAFTLARHFLYEVAEEKKLAALASSSHGPLAEVSEKLMREERYHQIHANAWFQRLASGPVEARHQFALALSVALPDAVGLFSPFPSHDEAVADGVIPISYEDLLVSWLDAVTKRIEEAGLPATLDPESQDQDLIPTSSGDLAASTSSDEQDGPTLPTFPSDLVAKGGHDGSHSEAFGSLWDDLTKTYREEPSATW